MTVRFDPAKDLEATEAALVDWKNRARRYGDKNIPVPKHITDRIQLLKEDAALLRQQIRTTQ